MMSQHSASNPLSFGPGVYVDGSQRYKGDVVLSGYKLFLKDAHNDLSKTFIPLEKVMVMKRRGSCLTFDVRPSLIERYTCHILLGRQAMPVLINEILEKRQLKKRLFRPEWVDISAD